MKKNLLLVCVFVCGTIIAMNDEVVKSEYKGTKYEFIHYKDELNVSRWRHRYSPQGSIFVNGGLWNNSNIYIHGVVKDYTLKTKLEHKNGQYVRDINFLDENILLAACHDKEDRLRDTNLDTVTKSEVLSLSKETYGNDEIEVRGLLSKWDIQKERQIYSKIIASLMNFKVGHDGKLMVAGAYHVKERAKIYDVDNGSLISEIKGSQGYSDVLRFNEDNNYVIIGAWKKLGLCDIRTMEIIKEVEIGRASSCSSDGKRIAAYNSNDDGLTLFDKDLNKVCVQEFNQITIVKPVYSFDNSAIISGTRLENNSILMSADDLEIKKTFNIKYLRGSGFTPDGNIYCIVDKEGNHKDYVLQVYDKKNYELIFEEPLYDEGDPIFHPDGKQMAFDEVSGSHKSFLKVVSEENKIEEKKEENKGGYSCLIQ